MKRILAKCAIDLGQLADRKNRGAEFIELHLRDNEPADSESIDCIVDRLEVVGLKAVVVHAPMDRDFIFEALGGEKANNKMRLVAQLAQRLYESHGEEVVVVIHQELYMSQIKSFGILERAEIILREILADNRGIRIAFENLSMVGKEENRLVVRGSYRESPIELAEYYNRKFGTYRFGTVLDVCHALNAIRIEEMIDKRVWSINEYIQKYADTLILVHLSNAIGLGFMENHGKDFISVEDKYLLHSILKDLENIKYTGGITLELVEQDHNNAELYEGLYCEIKNKFIQKAN